MNCRAAVRGEGQETSPIEMVPVPTLRGARLPEFREAERGRRPRGKLDRVAAGKLAEAAEKAAQTNRKKYFKEKQKYPLTNSRT